MPSKGLLLVLIFFSNFSIAQIFKTNEYYVELHKVASFQLIDFSGSLMPINGTQPLQELTSQLDKYTPVILLVSYSPGGFNVGFINMMKRLKNSGQRSVTMIINGPCLSSCTIWAALADKTYLVKETGSLHVHRTWIFTSDLTIYSPKTMASKYGKWGANKKWFLSHLYVFNKKYQKFGYELNLDESLESGLADKIIRIQDINHILRL
ncbi:MAG: hypothetical protein KDD34_06920 [Bdellovibrionales bacterium]|nr:hypothetical protein [Bdellovibrionales bacterium]